jgi:hypothetical protein
MLLLLQRALRNFSYSFTTQRLQDGYMCQNFTHFHLHYQIPACIVTSQYSLHLYRQSSLSFHTHPVHLDNYQSFFHQLTHNLIVLNTILNLH